MNISNDDFYLFGEGTHFHSYRFLGAHPFQDEYLSGVRFAVWAPHAKQVNVVGDFNSWQGQKHQMQQFGETGIWVLFVPDISVGSLYKYEIQTTGGSIQLKSDPYGFFAEKRPQTASIVYQIDQYQWQDGEWQKEKQQQVLYNRPMLIYEVHLGSWRRKPDGAFLNYRELADELISYVVDMGYTHVEIMPLAEHPLDASWGYQVTGYYAVTSRYGEPTDFMYFVDQCHQKGIGIIMDWVPGHFSKDAQGLSTFDGTEMFEYTDFYRRENPAWGTANFDLGKNQVQSYLISNAVFWFDVYHIDGLRVDAVANMLYLNYGRKEGEWHPNIYGGNENLEAIHFFQKLHTTIFAYYPSAIMAAEESTAWPLVTKPVYAGGLGFNYKWNMGWMNDMLRYLETDPIYRSKWHKLITFSMFYAFSENFILPISHDEVVHGKKSLLDKMPGDYWQKFAGLRVFLGYMLAHPGKKLFFMGIELGHFREWSEARELDWNLLNFVMHKKIQSYVRDLNHYYIKYPCLWQKDHDEKGFEWIDADDSTQSIVSFIRRGEKESDFLVIICNFTPVGRNNYRLGVPKAGLYRETFTSDNLEYGGLGEMNGEILAGSLAWHNQQYSLVLTVPPSGIVFLQLVTMQAE